MLVPARSTHLLLPLPPIVTTQLCVPLPTAPCWIIFVKVTRLNVTHMTQTHHMWLGMLGTTQMASLYGVNIISNTNLIAFPKFE